MTALGILSLLHKLFRQSVIVRRNPAFVTEAMVWCAAGSAQAIPVGSCILMGYRPCLRYDDILYFPRFSLTDAPKRCLWAGNPLDGPAGSAGICPAGFYGCSGASVSCLFRESFSVRAGFIRDFVQLFRLRLADPISGAVH